MKPSHHGLWALGFLCLATQQAGASSSSCQADQAVVINSESSCFPSGGIDIDYYGDDGIKVACMQDKRVQSACGPDGRVTRLQAYRQWLSRVDQFQRSCTGKGGTFAYQDPNFVEPQSENFCLQAQPVVSSNMFEEQLCNFHSLCPDVTVLCQLPCEGGHHEQAPEFHVTLR